jgi:dihydropteroate synthase
MGALRPDLPLGERTLVMGVLNVTPDSFSDGGRFASAEAAALEARHLAAEGADIVDIGGESTRPGADPVPLQTELARVIPVFDALKGEFPAALSVDTSKMEVARAAMARGAAVVNDVTAGRGDPELFRAVAAGGAYLVLMHMQGTPRDMQVAPRYKDVVAEVSAFLGQRADAARAEGVARGRIIVDPGIGFGKTLEHNLALLRAIPELKRLGYPVLVGHSRKSMFKQLFGFDDPAARDLPTALLTATLAAAGVDIVRVHNAGLNNRAAAVGDLLRPRG